MDDLEETIRQRLVEMLGEKGWSAAHFARRARLSARTVQKLLSGPAHIRLDQLDRMLQALKLTAHDVCGGGMPQAPQLAPDMGALVDSRIAAYLEKVSLERAAPGGAEKESHPKGGGKSARRISRKRAS